MKSLSLAKPLILVIVGVPGAGKSFFSRQFSDTFSAPLVSYDYLRHALFPDTVIPARDQQRALQQIADNEMSELVKTKKTFIVDGFGNGRAQRVELKKLAKEHEYDTLLVWVQTDVATAKYRSIKRSSRKHDDQYNNSLSPEQYEQLTKKFSSPLSTEQHVVISGKHTYATQARIVLKKLVAARESSPLQPSITGHQGRTPATSQTTPDNTPLSRRNVVIR